MEQKKSEQQAITGHEQLSSKYLAQMENIINSSKIIKDANKTLEEYFTEKQNLLQESKNAIEQKEFMKLLAQCKIESNKQTANKIPFEMQKEFLESLNFFTFPIKTIQKIQADYVLKRTSATKDSISFLEQWINNFF